MSIIYEIIYYQDGESIPVLEFIKSLTTKEQAKVLREIDLLQEFGFKLGMPHIEKMTGTEELWELRIKHSSNAFRIFYFHYVDGKFVLLHAIRKKTQKTPQRDINTALSRIKSFKNREDDQL